MEGDDDGGWREIRVVTKGRASTKESRLLTSKLHTPECLLQLPDGYTGAARVQEAKTGDDGGEDLTGCFV